jgi:hypothetical protein
MSNQYTIIQAIQDLGGINPGKLKKCGTETEWRELPLSLRLQIFRKSSSQGPDEIASQLKTFGIDSESDLLAYLKDPIKMSLSETEVGAYDLLLAELEAVKAERDRLAGNYKIGFVQVGRNFVPYRIPINDVPF